MRQHRCITALLSLLVVAACSDTSSVASRMLASQRTAHLDVLPDPAGPPPTIVMPAPIIAEATSNGTAVVDIGVPTAIDNAGNPVPVMCSAMGPTVFPLGTTMVTCSATDVNGLMSVAAMTVTVVDTTPPTIQKVASMSVAAMSSKGAVVEYKLPEAYDFGGGAVTVTCKPPSGSLFPVGKTEVICTAVDVAGNIATTSFGIVVTAPKVSPVDALISSLKSFINSLKLPLSVKSKLLSYVEQIPAAVDGLTPAQKLAGIQKARALIAFVQSLTPAVIPPAQASELINLAKQVIAVLSM